MTRHSLSVLGAALGVVLPSLSLAAPAPAASTDELFITATRTPEKLVDVDASIAVVSREELARATGAELSDLLRFRTGLEFSRSGGPGQNTSLFIRGADSNHSLVLVDGVRFNPGTIGGASLQNLPTALLERVEVVKGPLSTLYGSDAIGGVVQVFTRRPEHNLLDVGFGAGRWGSREANLQGALAGENLSLSFGASWLQSDGFPTQSASTLARGYDNRSYTVALRGEVGRAEVMLQGWRASGTAQYADFFLAPVDQDYVNDVAALTVRLPVNEQWSTTLRLSHMQDDLQQNQKPDYLVNFDSALTRRNTVDWQNDIKLGGHTLTAGALFQRETTRAASFDSLFDVATNSNSFYLQDRFALDAAANHGLLLGLGYTDHSSAGGQATWNAEYGWQALPTLRLTASAGTAFRAPDSTDRFGFGGNPMLAPEKARSVELAAAWEPAAGHQVRVAAFRNRITDLIQYVVTDFTTFDGQNRNVEEARIQGVEVGYHWHGEAWGLRVEGTRSSPRDVSNGGWLLRRARASASAGVERRFGTDGRHTLALDVLAAGARTDFGGARLAPYTVATLSANLELLPRWTAQVRLENLTDERYELARGYNTPRRALFASTRYSFR
ncbi:MAG: hypothetical protein RJB26_1286 [Pseudomonadota bacterium]